MNASWGQRYNLYLMAKEKHFPKIYAELEARNILGQTMDKQRYIKIRNAILYNEPLKALKLLEIYPIDYNHVDVTISGGEI